MGLALCVGGGGKVCWCCEALKKSGFVSWKMGECCVWLIDSCC